MPCAEGAPNSYLWAPATRSIMAREAVPSMRTMSSQPDTVSWVRFRPRRSPKEGPQSQLQRLAWFDEMWSELTSENRDLLIRNVERWHWSDTFAGFGSRDQIQCQIVTGLEERLKRRLLVPCTHCVTEKCKRRFRWLQEMHPRWKALHAERNVLDRLGDAKQQVLDLLPEKSASFDQKRAANLSASKFVDTLYASAPTSMSYSKCCNHCITKRCNPFPCSFLPKPHKFDLTEDSDAEFDDLIDESFVSATSLGVPCVDSSCMSNNAQGDAGPIMIATSTAMAGIKHASPKVDVVYIEVTKKWNATICADARPGCDTRKMLLQGKDIGDRYNRPRLAVLSLHPRMHLTAALEDYLQCAGSCVSKTFRASAFWMNSMEEDIAEKTEFSKQRVLPVDAEVNTMSWNELLHPTQRQYLHGYMQKFETLVHGGKACATDPFWCDLDQNPLGPRCRLTIDSAKKPANLQTLITHQTIYHVPLHRVFSARDHCRAHCWPMTTSERALVGCIGSIESKLQSKALSHSALKRFIGDGWHLRCQGLFIMWLLAHLQVKKSTRLVRQPNSFVRPNNKSKNNIKFGIFKRRKV